MAAENDDKPTTEEIYTKATGSSNLRFDEQEDSPMGASGLLIAAAWSPTRVGASLMRLHSEWDGAAKPEKPTEQDIEALASTVKSEVPEGLEKEALKEAIKHDTRRRYVEARTEAHRWYEQEVRALVGKLKSLPECRNQLAVQAMKWKYEDPVPMAGAVIKHWLDQTCPACDGLKFKQIPGTPSLSTKMCQVCDGSGTGEFPYGQQGRRLANYMDDCVSRARDSIKSRLRTFQR